MSQIFSGRIDSILYDHNKIFLTVAGKQLWILSLPSEPEFAPGDWCRIQVFNSWFGPPGFQFLEVESAQSSYKWKGAGMSHAKPTLKQRLNRIFKRSEIRRLEDYLRSAGDRRDWQGCDQKEAELYELTGYAQYAPLHENEGDDS